MPVLGGTLQAGFPGDAETGWLTADEVSEQAYLTRHRNMPCPALDPRSGTWVIAKIKGGRRSRGRRGGSRSKSRAKKKS